MSTVGTVVDRTLRQLLSGTVEERNKLASNLTATATSVTFTYELGGIRAGAVFQLDSEMFYVWDVNP